VPSINVLLEQRNPLHLLHVAGAGTLEKSGFYEKE
jgi:hypothetical protein